MNKCSKCKSVNIWYREFFSIGGKTYCEKCVAEALGVDFIPVRCRSCKNEATEFGERCATHDKEWDKKYNEGLHKKQSSGAVDWEDRLIEDKGGTPVYGRDIVQPYKNGHINQKFVNRYGDGMLKGKQSQLDGRGNKRKEVQREYKEVEVVQKNKQ